MKQAMSFFARPGLAVGFGAFLIAAEACRHYESLLSLPQSWLGLPIPDWIAGALLIYAGSRRSGDPERVQRLLTAAWAFNLSLLVTAFFSHLEAWSNAGAEETWMSEHTLTGIIGGLAVIALCGFIATYKTTTGATASSS